VSNLLCISLGLSHETD